MYSICKMHSKGVATLPVYNSVCLYSTENEMAMTEEICSFSKLVLEIAEFKMLLFCITLIMSHSSKTDILYT
jgi:hypothetical protein